MAKKKNKNIVPLKSISELKGEIVAKDYEFFIHFSHLCNLKPNKKLEKLDVIAIDTLNIKKEGLVYLFVINNYIFKIGHTITSISKRVQSYNCGKIEYRINGTNSTTNYFVLQSLLNLNKTVKVFAYFPKQPQYEVFGVKYTDSFPPSKRAENILMNNFIKKYCKKPIGCTQK